MSKDHSAELKIANEQLAKMRAAHPENSCYDVPTWNKLRARIIELEAALKGMVGLVQLVNSRKIIPDLEMNHRFQDALACFPDGFPDAKEG